jgi:hypothetical protein
VPFIVGSIRNTQIHSVGRVAGYFLMSKCLAQIVTAILWMIHVIELYKIMLAGFQNYLSLFEQKIIFLNSACSVVIPLTNKHMFTSMFSS